MMPSRITTLMLLSFPHANNSVLQIESFMLCNKNLYHSHSNRSSNRAQVQSKEAPENQ